MAREGTSSSVVLPKDPIIQEFGGLFCDDQLVIVFEWAVAGHVGVLDDDSHLTRAFERAGERQVGRCDVATDEVGGAVALLGPAEEHLVGDEAQIVPLLVDVHHHLEPVGVDGAHLEARVVAVGDTSCAQLLLEAGLEHGGILAFFETASICCPQRVAAKDDADDQQADHEVLREISAHSYFSFPTQSELGFRLWLAERLVPVKS